MEDTAGSASGYSGRSDTGARDTGTPVMDRAKQQTQEIAYQAQEKAGQVMDQAREQVRSQLESQKERATGSLETITHALRQTGDQLQTQEQAVVGRYVHSAADLVQQTAGYLRERDVQELTADVEDFARRQPALFLGGAFALGFVAARFLKSSGERARPAGNGYGRAALARYPEDVPYTPGYPTPSDQGEAGQVTPMTATAGQAWSSVDTSAASMAPGSSSTAPATTPSSAPAAAAFTGGTGMGSTDINSADTEDTLDETDDTVSTYPGSSSGTGSGSEVRR